MDLIKIFESGKFDELEELLKEMVDNNLEYVELYRHFHSYFWEIEEEMKNCGIMPNLVIRKDLDRNKIYEDSLFPKFKDYSDKFLGAKIKCIDEPKDIRACISDAIGIEFYNKYFCRGLKKYSFKTTIEEAVEYGNQRIIDFLVREYHLDLRKKGELVQ